MNEKTIDAFDSIALKYDSNRKRLIPCFDELYSIPISLITLIPEKSKRLNVTLLFKLTLSIRNLRKNTII